jgi:uncharacterized protein YpbB
MIIVIASLAATIFIWSTHMHHQNVCTVTTNSYEVAAGCNATLHESFVSALYYHNMSSNAELNHKWNSLQLSQFTLNQLHL